MNAYKHLMQQHNYKWPSQNCHTPNGLTLEFGRSVVSLSNGFSVQALEILCLSEGLKLKLKLSTNI